MYRTICLDPPWNERGGGKIKRGADRHYKLTRKKEDILKDIMRSGEFTPDPACCSVWLWATVNHLPDAMWLMEKLGAKYVTNAVWVKADSYAACPDCRAPWHEGADRCWRGDACLYVGEPKTIVLPLGPGLGQRVRMCHEHLLFGRIGKVPVPSTGDRMPSTIYAPRGRHSEKPQAAYDLICRHDGPGPKLDMFARKQRDGWDVWGDEV